MNNITENDFLKHLIDVINKAENRNPPTEIFYVSNTYRVRLYVNCLNELGGDPKSLQQFSVTVENLHNSPVRMEIRKRHKVDYHEALDKDHIEVNTSLLLSSYTNLRKMIETLEFCKRITNTLSTQTGLPILAEKKSVDNSDLYTYVIAD